MSDEIDQQQTRDEILEDAQRKIISDAVAKIPVGAEGECDMCGEWSGRLIRGACAPCRDKYKLP